MDEPLRLIIKAPNQKYEDLKIDCNHAWSVLDLKRFLNQEYSFKPEVKGQRLIYSGHLLKDSQLVREVISSRDESPYIFHLVYWSNNQASNTAAGQQPNSGSGTTNGLSTASPLSSQSAQQQNSSFPTSDNNNSSSQSTPGAPNLSSPDQRLEYFRAYNLMMSDYYRDMSQRYALAGLNGQPLHDEEAFFRSMIARPAPGFLLNPGSANRQAPQVRIIIRRRNSNDQEARGFLPNIRNLARNFERAFEGRDLVQDMFTFFKALFMSSMILVYSSSNRLLIVLAIGFLLYFHQFRRPQPPQQVQPQPPAQQQPQPANDGANENNNNNNVNSNNDNVNNNNENIPQASRDPTSMEQRQSETVPDSDPNQQRQSRFRFIAEVVSSIFTSLIPEPPNVNQ